MKQNCGYPIGYLQESRSLIWEYFIWVTAFLLSGVLCGCDQLLDFVSRAEWTQFSYANQQVIYEVGEQIQPNRPEIAGLHYQISQSLPRGLEFNAETGVVSGTPTVVTEAKSYTITVRRPSGYATTQLVIEVKEPNKPPEAKSSAFSVDEDSSLSAGLVASDPEGRPLYYSIVTNAGKGNAVMIDETSGTFRYTPKPDENGQDSFTFKVNDGSFDSNAVTVTIAINSINDAPTSFPKTFYTIEDNAVTGNLSALDIDGDPLQYRILQVPILGKVLITDAGAFTYTPNPNANGSDSFAFKVNDGSVDSNISVVNITIAAVNDDSPIATSDTLNMESGSSKQSRLLASDPDGDALTFSIDSQPSFGKVTIQDATTGDFTYEITAFLPQADQFSFVATDKNGMKSNVATIQIIPPSLWEKSFGSSVGDTLTTLSADKEGNLLVAGYTFGSFDGEPPQGGASNAVILKLDKSGHRVWLKQLGNDVAYDAVIDHEGNYVVLMVKAGRFLLRKMDPDGNKIWEKDLLIDYSYLVSQSLTVDAFGNIFVLGSFFSYRYYQWRIGILKLTPDGSIAWTHEKSADGQVAGHHISVDRDGNIIIAYSHYIRFYLSDLYGISVEKMDPNRRIIWERKLGAGGAFVHLCSASIDGSGNVFLTGTTTGNFEGEARKGGYDDAFAAKLKSTDGTTIWKKQLGGTGSDKLSDSAVDSSGNLLVVGHTDGDFEGLKHQTTHGWDAVIVKVDPMGAIVEKALIPSNKMGLAITLTPSGTVFIGGAKYSTSDTDFFIQKLTL